MSYQKSLSVLTDRLFCYLIVFFSYFKIALRMLTYRTNIRGFGSYNEMSAVAAFPHYNAAFFKDFLGFDIMK